MKKKPSKKALPKYKNLPKYNPGGTYNGYQESTKPWSIDTSNDNAATGRRRGPVASAADQDQIDQQNASNQSDSWNGPSAAQYAQGAAEIGKGAVRINQIQNSDLGDTNKTNQTATALGDTATGVAGVVPGVGAMTAVRKPLTGMIGTKTGIQRAGTNAAAGPHELFFDSLGQYKSGDNGQQKLGSVLASAGAIGGGTKLAQNASITFNKDKETKGAWGFYNDMSGLTSKNNQQRDMDLENNPVAAVPVTPYDKDNRQDAVWQRENGYYGEKSEFAMGGMNGMPNAEVERQEVMRSPDGSTMQVDGPSHEQGGVPVSLEPGTQIYSDRLKMPGTKKTFAKLAEKFKTGKEEKVLANPSADLTAKTTANLIASVKQQKLSQLFQAQESLKQSKVQAYAKKLGVTLPQDQPQGEPMIAKHGGMLPKYGNGIKTPALNFNSTPYYGQGYNPNGLQVNENDPNSLDFNNDSMPYIQNGSNMNYNYQQSMQPWSLDKSNDLNYKEPGKNDYVIPEVRSDKKNVNYNEYIEPTVNTLLQNAGNLVRLNQLRKGYDKEDFGKVNPKYYKPQTVDATESIRDAYRQAAAARNSLKGINGGHAGATMANLVNIQTANTAGIAAIRQANRNQNAGILNRADEGNVGIYNAADQMNLNLKNQADMATKQNKARWEDIGASTAGNIGTNTASAYRDYKANTQQDQMVKYISTMYPNYTFDQKKGWYFNSAGKPLEIKDQA